MQLVGPEQRLDGALYPSRRYRGHDAMIYRLRQLTLLRASITLASTRFIEHPIFPIERAGAEV
ncbi:UNVERIFIED_ORG: hypothetical protein ABIC48_000731 [Burkholderia territorii]